MPPDAACANTISFLPALEPMAAAALAITLAYLNLERFRYRKSIRDCASKELDRLRQDGQPPPLRVARNKWYKQIARLAALPDNDGIANEAKSPEKHSAMPPGTWGKVYVGVFEHHQDRWASMIFAGLALLVLFFGTAQSANYLQIPTAIFEGGLGMLTYCLLVVGIVGPIILVLFGRQVVKWGQAIAKEQVRELEELLQEDVEKAALKPPD